MVKINFSHAKNNAFIAILLSVNVNAAEVKTLADLDLLQGETMYYRALATRNEAKSKAGDDIQQQTNTVGQPNQTSKVFTPVLPSVLSIMGNQKGLLARLGYSDGQVSTNKVGDIVNGTLKITKIGITGVQVLSLQENKFYDLKEAQN
ncbi:type IV pilus biogenesis protein PilP [Lelliottia amnigena]|uniref:type IV pilus biogenesis protein PilP n=1 Tax=Lelliottia amnigena TaxID=61646 RepID=UPI001039DD75|nr:type IV pilus biogenesis protein PilP [Lelliottia amnigena]TCD12253.1 type IV pilus biogenesis protein PilP [Lelliottia amnigena]